MRIVVYTSCAANYYAKARALCDSLARTTPDSGLVLCLCDEPPEGVTPGRHGFAACWTPADLGFDRAWVFKHNIMELCTAVKGRALQRLMDEHPEAELFVYLDPDVFVYGDLGALPGMLGDASVGLVPHITAPEQTEVGVQMTEMSVARHGVYNLGHLILRNDAAGRAVADWWAARLDRHCYDDPAMGLFTDQRWMDLVPAMFERVAILRQPTLDVASWNLSHRRIEAEPGAGEDRYRIDGQALLTYHFSGTGPNGVHRRVRKVFDPGNPATAEIERRYEEAIAARGQAALERCVPAFDLFDDGTPVTAAMRKIFRDHPDLQSAFPDPYATEGRSFLGWLRAARPEVTGTVAVPPWLMDKAFRDLFDAAYYLARYPAAKAAIKAGHYESALDHYVRMGSALLYDPSEFFVSRYYLDRARSFEFPPGPAEPIRERTLLWHYLSVGLPNGIEPIEHFDSAWYVRTYPDLARALRSGLISSPLAHYLSHGSRENRSPGPDFDAQGRLAARAGAGGAPVGPLGVFGDAVRAGEVAGRLAAEAPPRGPAEAP